MNSRIYRLLRNNKEEGPFTAGEIIRAGLKPYDLIWIDGRSAAWSYPGEINEFKALVATPQNELLNGLNKCKELNAVVSSTVQAAVAVNDNLAQASATKQLKPRFKVSAAWSKIQTITTPVYSDVLVAEPKKASSTKKPLVAGTNNFQQTRSLSWEEAWKDWETEKSGSVINQPEFVNPQIIPNKRSVNEVAAQTAPVLETKFKQSLDTLTDSYIDNLLKQKKRAKSFSFGKASEFVLPSIALIVIFSIGYWLMNGHNKPSVSLTPSTTKQAPSNEVLPDLNKVAANSQTIISQPNNITEQKNLPSKEPATNTEVKTKSNSAQTAKLVVPVASNVIQQNNNDQVAQNNQPKIVQDNETKKTIQPTEKQFDPSVINNVPNDKAYNDAAAPNNGDLNAAENRPVRRRTNAEGTTNAPPAANQSTDNSTNNIKSKSSARYVNVPEYIQMNDGSGSVKVQNTSDVDLDLVVVDVLYYDGSGRYEKGETLYLHNLKAGKTVTIKTPRDLNSSYATSKVSLVSSDANGVYAIGDN